MMVDTLAQEVEKEKLKAIGTRNLIKSMAKPVSYTHLDVYKRQS